MASVAFDNLWDEAFEREGELFLNAQLILHDYKLSSMIEAVRLSRVFHVAGQSFYDHCDDIFHATERRLDERVKRRYHLSASQLAFAKKILAEKAKKGGW